MSVKKINDALEHCIKNKNNYAGLVHTLCEIGCSDRLIKAIVVGALGAHLRDRVEPLIAMARAYANLSPSEQIDMLYSIVDKQDSSAQSKEADKKITA